MKVRSTGETPHQFRVEPKGTKELNKAGMNALKMARYIPKKFVGENKIPNPKEAKRVTKVAFNLFSMANKPNP